MLVASGQHMLGSQDICLVKQFPRSPDSCHGRNMKDAIDLVTCVDYLLSVAQIASDQFHPKRPQFRIVAPAQNPYLISSGQQPFHDVAAKEPAAAGESSEPSGSSRITGLEDKDSVSPTEAREKADSIVDSFKGRNFGRDLLSFDVDDLLSFDVDDLPSFDP